MYFLRFAPVFLALLSSTLWGNETACFDSPEAEEAAVLKMKIQLACANSSYEECRKILFPPQSPKAEYSPATFVPLSCSASAQTISSPFNSMPPVFSSLAAGLGSATANRRTYVNSVVDFHHHTQLHKKRVVRLALAALKEFPDEFEGLTPRLVEEVLSRHDNAKVGLDYRHKDGSPLLEKLYRYFGKKAPQEVIDQLNAADAKIMKAAYAEQRLLPLDTDSAGEKARKEAMLKKLEKLEKLADFTDRGMASVTPEEFGRKVWKESEAGKKAGNKELETMARYLENNYERITQGLGYKKLPPAAYLKSAQSLAADKRLAALKASGKTLKEMGTRAMEGLGRFLSSKVISSTGKLLGRAAITAAGILDGVALFVYPRTMGCSSMPGRHDWVIEDGECKPQYGLTPTFISFLDLGPAKRQKEYLFSDHMCSVAEENLKLLENTDFQKVECSEGSAKLFFGKNDYVSAQFNQTGQLKALDFRHLQKSFGVFAAPPKRITFKNGMPSGTCSAFGRGKTMEICRDADPDKPSRFYKKFSSMNLQLNQAIAACLSE